MLARHLAADLAQREEALAEQLRDLEVRAADVEESERDIAARLENLDAREANMDKLDAEAQALRDTVRVHSAPAQPLLTAVQFSSVHTCQASTYLVTASHRTSARQRP